MRRLILYIGLLELTHKYTCISPIVVGRGDEADGWQTGDRVCAFGAAEEQDMGLWLMDFVVDPASGLLDAQCPPLLLAEELALLGDFLHDLFGENHVPVLVVVVVVLLGVFDFRRVVRHLNIIIINHFNILRNSQHNSTKNQSSIFPLYLDALHA